MLFLFWGYFTPEVHCVACDSEALTHPIFRAEKSRKWKFYLLYTGFAQISSSLVTASFLSPWVQGTIYA